MTSPAASRTVLPPIAAEVARPGRGRWRWARRAIILAVVLAVAVLLRLTYLRPALVSVTVVRVETGRVEDLVTNNKAGTVTARRQASLSPEMGGRVASIPVEEGDRVRKGAMLLVLADDDQRAQVALQARALEASRSAATEACAHATLAGVEFDRTRRLLADGAVAQQAFDLALNQKVTADAACAAATSRVGQAAASADVSRLTLRKAVIRAPFDGVVSKIATHVGEWISPAPAGQSMPTAIELVDPQSIYVRAPLDEVDAGKVRPALTARITLDAFPGRSFPARVTRVATFVSEAQQQNRTFDIELAFDDHAFAQTLLPGTSADAEIVLSARDGVLVVPTSAILQGSRVLVARDGVLVSVPVRTGLANWEVTEITEGLQAGDAVVTSLDRPEVREGARVRITPERTR